VRSRFWGLIGLVLLAAIGIRIPYVLTVTRHDHHFYDATYYQLQAASIANGDGFFVDPFAPFEPRHAEAAPAADHPPFTTLVLVPAALIGDPSDSALAMRFTMVVVGLAAVVVIGLLGRELGGDTVGVVAAGIAALDPNLWMNDGLIMSEALSVLLVSVMLLCAYRVLRGASMRWVVGLGMACGLLALVRAELAVLTLFLAVPAVWSGRRRRAPDDASRPWAATAACVGVAVLVVMPWVGFNLARFDRPVLISTNDGLALIGANCDPTYYGSGIGTDDIRCRLTRPGDQSVVDAANRSAAFHYLRDHAQRWPVVVLARVGRLWSVFHVGQTVGLDVLEGRPRWASYAGVVTLYLLAPLAIYGAVARRRASRSRGATHAVPIWPLVVPIAVVTAVMLFIGGLTRYRAPAEPSIVVLAALGAVALLTRRPGRTTSFEVAEARLGSAAGCP
jgi:4-amino-4-deoxy-L-arabinose transferase-like glycosyltransferase